MWSFKERLVALLALYGLVSIVVMILGVAEEIHAQSGRPPLKRGWTGRKYQFLDDMETIPEQSPLPHTVALPALGSSLFEWMKVLVWLSLPFLVITIAVLTNEVRRGRREQAAVQATEPDFDQALAQMAQNAVVIPRLSRFVSEVKAQRGLIVPTVSELVVSIRIAGQKMKEQRISPELIAEHQFAVGVKALILTDSERRALQILSQHGMAEELKRTSAFFSGQGYERPTLWGFLIGRNSLRDWWQGGFAMPAK